PTPGEAPERFPSADRLDAPGIRLPRGAILALVHPGRPATAAAARSPPRTGRGAPLCPDGARPVPARPGLVAALPDPTNEVVGYLFGVSDSTASRRLQAVLPLLELLGLASRRLPDPKTAPRQTLPELLRDTPGLAVVIDSFEQRVQRPRGRAR